MSACTDFAGASAKISVLKAVSIRRAVPEEAGALSDLAMRSKAHWGYSDDFIDRCRKELTLSAEQIRRPQLYCYVATDGDGILGFYTAAVTTPETVELDALFVEPKHIGCGVGRALITHAIERVSDCGARTLIIQGDPNATEFYLAMGGREVGHRESESIPGRLLPVFEIDVRRHSDRYL